MFWKPEFLCQQRCLTFPTQRRFVLCLFGFFSGKLPTRFLYKQKNFLKQVKLTLLVAAKLFDQHRPLWKTTTKTVHNDSKRFSKIFFLKTGKIQRLHAKKRNEKKKNLTSLGLTKLD